MIAAAADSCATSHPGVWHSPGLPGRSARPAADGARPTVGRACDVTALAAGTAARAEWCTYVERCPSATLFHTPAWCDAVRRAFGHRPRHLLARRAGRIVGVLPLFEVRSLLAGRLLVSVPYGTYGGPAADDAEAHAALVLAAGRLARSSGVRSLELRSACDARGLERSLGGQVWHDGRHAVFLRDLPGGLEALGGYLPRKARAAARRAQEREGLRVSHDPAQLVTVWQLYARSMRRLGSLNYPYRFFRELARALGPELWVTCVWQPTATGRFRRGVRPIAGVVSFAFRNTVMPYFAGLDERTPCTGATNLMYLEVMRRAVEAGLRRFDFGRTRIDNRGAWEFKCHQGFAPRPLAYARYVPRGGRPPVLCPGDARFAAARAAWRRLPLWLTRPLGARLSTSVIG